VSVPVWDIYRERMRASSTLVACWSWTEKSRIICVGTVVLCVSLILCSVINTSKLLLLRSLASWSVLCFYLIYGLSPNLSTLLPRAPFCSRNIFFK